MEETKLFTESSPIIHPRSIGTNFTPKSLENPKKKPNYLPKLFNGKPLNIYSYFVLYSNSGTFNVNIPTTLIKTEDSQDPYLIRTKTNGVLHCRTCSHTEFFTSCQKHQNSEFHKYLYKSLYRESIVFQSQDLAEEFWKSTKDSSGMIQCYVECITTPISTTRVLWRAGRKTRYYNIISCDKPIIRSRETHKRSTCPAVTFKKKKTVSIDFRYTNMIFRTSSSMNNPFKVNTLCKSNLKERPKLASTLTEPNLDDTNLSPKKSKSDDPSLLMFRFNQKKRDILDVNNPDSFIAIENKNKVPEIEAMINEIISFLNAHVFKEEELKGAIFEFMNNKDNKWVLLNCKEVSLNAKLPAEIINLKKCEERSQKRRSKSFVVLKTYENKMDSPEIDTHLELEKRHSVVSDKIKLPFRIRTTSKPTQAIGNCTEKEIFERCQKVNEKFEQIVNLNPLNYLKDVDFKEQSIKAYQVRYQLENYSFFASQNKPDTSTTENSPLLKQESTTNAVFSDKVLHHTRKLISEGINHLDEMKMNTELLKVRSHNLVGKYGGSDFWNQFISSLYKKVMSFESLNAYFKNSNMKMIISGMFKIFNGCATLEFRRHVRSSHTTLGISENNFSLYIKLFEDTLIEFEVEEDDKQIIMAQIKSMKCLICR